jgi:hypothetical protein
MKKAIFRSALLLSSISFLSVAHGVTISMSLPGDTSTSTSPGGFVNYFYQYALGVGGILAFGVVVYGGVRYMISAGNPSGQSDAKEWIKAALMGLLLLAGAYFILNVINPKLTNLTLPTLQPPMGTTTSTTGNSSSGFTGYGGDGAGFGGAGAGGGW